MYSILIAFAVLCIGISGKEVNQEIIVLSPQFVATVLPLIEKCAEKTNPPPNYFHKMLRGIVEDEATLSFMQCYLPKAGFVTEDGHLDVKNFVEFVKRRHPTEKLQEVLEECNKLKGTDSRETLRIVARCYNENSPLLFTV